MTRVVRTTRRVLGAFIYLVVAAAIWSVAVLDADASGPATWPDGEIVYSDKSQWSGAVRAAVWQWNTAQVGVRFRAAQAGEQPDLVISSDDERAQEFCGGAQGPCEAFATFVGHRDDAVSEVVLPSARNAEEQEEPTHPQIRLAVHELGHILGLDHRAERCAVMNPNVALRECDWWKRAYRQNERFCGPLASDVSTAAAMYGGPGRSRPYCL